MSVYITIIMNENYYLCILFQSQCLSNFTIENFLEQPKQHLMKLTENFRDIVKLLKPQSGAHRELKLVVNGKYINLLNPLNKNRIFA